MSYLLQSAETIDKGPISHESGQQSHGGNSPRTTSIHILDDYSLLNIFYLYRPRLSGEGEDIMTHIKSGGQWDNGHWWFKLTHVCQRWRDLILGSQSYLGLCLVCKNGTPVADMLIHSPPLPLVIDYDCLDGCLTEEDEQDIVLALEQHELVRYIRLIIPVLDAHNLFMAIGEEYPTLEYLILTHPTEVNTDLIYPTLQAPHLRHLALYGGTLPKRPRLLITAMGLVTLCLAKIKPLHIRPAVLLQWLSFLPQLENLICLSLPARNHAVERQLIRTPITTHITLPNLRLLMVESVSAYLETLFRRITTPRLEELRIGFFTQRTFSVPWLLQFINTTKNFSLRFVRAKFKFFDKRVYVEVYSLAAKTVSFSITVRCRHLDRQVTSVAQIFNALSQMFSGMEHLTLGHEVHSQSEEHNEVDRTEWRKLLRSFRDVKTLHIDSGLIEEVSRCLRLEDGEHPLGVLPELQELTYPGSGNAGDVFTSFIDSRQNAGRPVILIQL
ncbi:hypothetical protein BGY98DRAFT_1096701 [Russula aff. rugulosa BPL654]|nr:hypothetical protein BGY98DRAFT_1096701 [Russula aff. rugulosa BPL654]